MLVDLNTGRMTMELERVDLSEILQAASEQMAGGFAKRQQTLRILNETSSPFVVGDSGRLTQLIASLLDRVSVTAANGAVITASVYDHAGDVIIAVADGDDGSAGHDASAERLELSDMSQSSETDSLMTVSVLVVIELLKSHGGALALTRSPDNEHVRFQCVLPRPH